AIQQPGPAEHQVEHRRAHRGQLLDGLHHRGGPLRGGQGGGQPVGGDHHRLSNGKGLNDGIGRSAHELVPHAKRSTSTISSAPMTPTSSSQTTANARLRPGSSAFMVQRKTSIMQMPTAVKTMTFTTARTNSYGSASEKNQLTGTLASIASAPKLTVASAASTVVDASSFDPSELLMM